MTANVSFKAKIRRLITQPGIPGKAYYCLTRLATDDGKLLTSRDSRWVGYTDTRPRREIREATPLDGPMCRKNFLSIGQTCLLINSEADLRLWYAFGGHAVIVEEVAKARLAGELAPREVARASGAIGFIATHSLAEAQLQHAPSKTTRMKVLTRDGRRCFICGRSPAHYVDLELHVHHIVPWGEGGVTEPENLVTLCGTCHEGLDPHFDWGLALAVREKHYAESPEYIKQLKNYQQCVRRLMQKEP